MFYCKPSVISHTLDVCACECIDAYQRLHIHVSSPGALGALEPYDWPMDGLAQPTGTEMDVATQLDT